MCLVSQRFSFLPPQRMPTLYHWSSPKAFHNWLGLWHPLSSDMSFSMLSLPVLIRTSICPVGSKPYCIIFGFSHLQGLCYTLWFSSRLSVFFLNKINTKSFLVMDYWLSVTTFMVMVLWCWVLFSGGSLSLNMYWTFYLKNMQVFWRLNWNLSWEKINFLLPSFWENSSLRWS